LAIFSAAGLSLRRHSRTLAQPIYLSSAPWLTVTPKRLPPGWQVRSSGFGTSPNHDLLVLEDQPKHRPMETADGKTLVLEAQVFWDDGKRRNPGAIVDVWDPSQRMSRSIAKDDFIRAPDGSFVDE
jgi:hypothetical protein